MKVLSEYIFQKFVVQVFFSAKAERLRFVIPLLKGGYAIDVVSLTTSKFFLFERNSRTLTMSNKL